MVMDLTGETGDVTRSAVRRFLEATDLDELASARAAIGDAEVDVDDQLEIEAVVNDWDDTQAVANLLMYPQLLPAADRVSLLRRGLDDDRTYLRLAATVGLGELDLAEFADETRHELVQSLLDLIVEDSGCVADRASFAVVWLLRPTDAPEVAECLGHPSKTVRHNLTHGLLTVLDTAGLAALLDEPGFVPPAAQQVALQRLAVDGIDLDQPAVEQQRPLILAYLPNLTDWTE